MDPFSALMGGLGLAGLVGSFFSTSNANSIAQQNLNQQTQLLNEAQQQEQQQAAQPGLIAQRTAQEQDVKGTGDKWTASGTLLGGLTEAEKQPTASNKIQPQQQLLGV